jgi:hypothetical protein
MFPKKGEKMEGFWLVQFTGVQGFGGGAVTLVNGKVFGGDSGFMYSGSYADQGGKLHAKIHVKRSFPGTQSVMGLDNFDLELTGTLQGNTIAATGSVPGSPLRFQATLTKQGDI